MPEALDPLQVVEKAPHEVAGDGHALGDGVVHGEQVAPQVVHAVEVLHPTGAVGVVTTEKDAVRLLPLRPLRLPVAVVPLAAEVEPAAAFADWVPARVREARR